jgi:hypothetical protein
MALSIEICVGWAQSMLFETKALGAVKERA